MNSDSTTPSNTSLPPVPDQASTAHDPLMDWQLYDMEERIGVGRFPCKFIVKRPFTMGTLVFRPKETSPWVCLDCFRGRPGGGAHGGSLQPPCFNCIHIRRVEKEYELLPHVDFMPTADEDIVQILHMICALSGNQLEHDAMLVQKVRSVACEEKVTFPPTIQFEEGDDNVTPEEREQILELKPAWRMLEMALYTRMLTCTQWNNFLQCKSFWDEAFAMVKKEFGDYNLRITRAHAKVKRALGLETLGTVQEKKIEEEGCALFSKMTVSTDVDGVVTAAWPEDGKESA